MSLAVRDTDHLSDAITLPRDLASVARARAWVAERLRDSTVTEERCRDLVLMASELVTNALCHGTGAVVCRLSVSRDGSAVHLGVGDDDEHAPQLLPADPERIGGLGLRLVDRTARRWGTASYPGGKVVWATVPGR